ncbi:DnaJ domain-containing protein [Rubrivivax gelatinosus]|uniref:DnaJ-like protein n=1 Tax=Rubrivivax gelatinosus TaxID=28068 RepID=A0A4R2MY03_RUBGE|nr:DnaJ domain-containing protein [Rubrivivax gelatinosus]TCP05733.1 DnaJ-like protein [Rubrivivax gelatinosus]
MTINAYPLHWPEGWKRTPAGGRRPGHFGKRRQQRNGAYAMLEDLTVTEAVRRVLEELQRMGIDRQDVVISTNVRTRLDGLPRAGERAPEDPGAAVYWQEPIGARRCIAVDQYLRVEHNLAAIAATLDAMRAIERHGGAAILERAFTGFTALPAPGAAREWWEVLGVARSSTLEQARAAYRRLAALRHPDRGGDAHEMAAINAAWQAAQEAIGGGRG